LTTDLGPPRTHPLYAPPLGATLRAGGVEVLVMDGAETDMTREADGYWTAFVAGAGAGSRYGIRLTDAHDAPLGPPFPDPCSRSQPEGVHGLSEVVDPDAFAWTDDGWAGVPLRDYVLYELHVGTFTPAGTFAAAMERLPYLRDLGVTAVELMPLHAFPGRFNWGYDPGALWAVPASYGTSADLRRLVDRAHALGLAVVADVVLNHLGPDGAYVAAFAPMLTPAATPWGDAMNLAGPHSAGVRRFLVESALLWLREYHMDGLRLDATSRLLDPGEPHLLAEISAAAEALPGPRRVLIAEDLRNRAVVTRPRAEGGYGMDSQWVDDLHGQARALGTPGEAYWEAYHGATARDIAATLRDGWAFTGSVPRKQDDLRASAPEGPLTRVVHYLDDHDLTGNRPHGDRLTATLDPALFRALSAALLFSPALPQLWMGQEWAASTPFPFFADHAGALAASVRAGRQRDYDEWWRYEGMPPDPCDLGAFQSARLDWSEPAQPPHSGIHALYRRLLALRPTLPDAFMVEARSDAGFVLRRGRYSLAVALHAGTVLPEGPGACVLTTEDAVFGGAGPPGRADGPTASALAVLYAA
jgi:maltooligosyltrehalose trehalohydrolase